MTGTRAGHTIVLAVDCHGARTVITGEAPFVEGGFAVAPLTFGPYAGDLIVPDELSGQVLAFSYEGAVRLVAIPDLPTGGDIGIESLGFVPPGFIGAGGSAYLADRGTPGNPFPGTDTLLRLSASALAAGVQDGDLLGSTEGGGLTVAIRCDAASCVWIPVAAGPQGAAVGHIEGHITFAP